MRFVFSSPRLETAEGVVELLKQHGIESFVRNGRSYKGTRRSTPSFYRETENPPEVWVTNNSDLTQARQILRDAQLLDSTRDRHSYLTELEKRDDARAAKQRKALWIRLGLFGILLAVAAAMFINRVDESSIDKQLAGPFDGKSRVLPASLAVTGLQKGISYAVMPVACISLSGEAPPQALMAQLDGMGKRILPKSHCVENRSPDVGTQTAGGELAEIVEVRNFRPKSATTGLVDVESFHHAQWGHYRTFEVSLINGRWVIGNMVRHVAL